MKQFFIGRSPLTSIAGLLLAALFVIRDLNASGLYSWQEYLLPIAIAILGRVAADDKRRPSFSSIQASIPKAPRRPKLNSSEGFLRRGRRHMQERAHNGRFATATTPTAE